MKWGKKWPGENLLSIKIWILDNVYIKTKIHLQLSQDGIIFKTVADRQLRKLCVKVQWQNFEEVSWLHYLKMFQILNNKNHIYLGLIYSQLSFRKGRKIFFLFHELMSVYGCLGVFICMSILLKSLLSSLCNCIKWQFFLIWKSGGDSLM